MVERYNRVLIVPEGRSMKARSSGRGAETGSEVTEHTDVRVVAVAGLSDSVVAGPVPVVAIAVER